MSSLPPAPADSEVPSSPGQSAWVGLTRRLLCSAVRSYQQALAFAREVDAYFPVDYRLAKNFAEDDEGLLHRRTLSESEHRWPDGDHGRWLRLMYEADSAYYAAEVELATRIANLYNILAPADKQAEPARVGSEYSERAVSVEGRTYMLLYDPAQFEAGQIIIAVTPIERTVVLDD